MNNYIVGNINIDDTTSDDKYVAIATSNVKKFNLPTSMQRFSFMQVGDDMVDFIAQNNIATLDNYEYDKKQIDNKIASFKNDISKYISDIIGVDNTQTYRNDILNDDKLIIRNLSR